MKISTMTHGTHERWGIGLIFLFMLPFFLQAASDPVSPLRNVAAEIARGIMNREAVLDNRTVHFDDTSAGLLPSHFGYFVDIWAEEIALFREKDEAKKITKLLSNSHERLEELSMLFLQDKIPDKAWEKGASHLQTQISELYEKLAAQKNMPPETRQMILRDFFVMQEWINHNLIFQADEESHIAAKTIALNTFNHTENEFRKVITIWEESNTLSDLSFPPNRSGSVFQFLQEAAVWNRLMMKAGGEKGRSDSVQSWLTNKRAAALKTFFDQLQLVYAKESLQSEFAAWTRNIDGNPFGLLLLLEDTAVVKSEGVRKNIDLDEVSYILRDRLFLGNKNLSADAYQALFQPARDLSSADQWLILGHLHEFGKTFHPGHPLNTFLAEETKKLAQEKSLPDPMMTHDHVDFIFILSSVQQPGDNSVQRFQSAIDALFLSMYDCTAQKSCNSMDILSSDPAALAFVYQLVQENPAEYARFKPLAEQLKQRSFFAYQSTFGMIEDERIFSWYSQRSNALKNILQPQEFADLTSLLSQRSAVFAERNAKAEELTHLVENELQENAEIAALVKDSGDDILHTLQAHGDEYHEILENIAGEIRQSTQGRDEDLRALIRQGLEAPPKTVDTSVLVTEITTLLEKVPFDDKAKSFFESYIFKLKQNMVNEEGFAVLLQELDGFYATLPEEIQAQIAELRGIPNPSDDEEAPDETSEKDRQEQESDETKNESKESSGESEENTPANDSPRVSPDTPAVNE